MPKNKKRSYTFFFAAIVLFFFFIQLPGYCQEKSGHLINIYQKYISGSDGDRCPMAPTCSEYAAQSFEKHGLIIGWIMTSDRLMRCGRDELKRMRPFMLENGVKKCPDSVSGNDFWWFKR